MFFDVVRKRDESVEVFGKFGGIWCRAAKSGVDAKPRIWRVGNDVPASVRGCLQQLQL
jgi:hypothetical protein